MAGSKTVVAKEKALAVAAAAVVDSGAYNSSTTCTSSSLLRGGELLDLGMTHADLNVWLIPPQLDAGVSAALPCRAVTESPCGVTRSSSSSSAAATLARCCSSTNAASFAAHSVNQKRQLGGQESAAFLPNALWCPPFALSIWRQRQLITKLYGLHTRRLPALPVPDAALQLNLVDKDCMVIITKVQEQGLQRSDTEVPCDGELLASEAGQQLPHGARGFMDKFSNYHGWPSTAVQTPAHPRPWQRKALWQQDVLRQALRLRASVCTSLCALI